MKFVSNIALIVLMLLCVSELRAQVPQSIKYQAAARDAGGGPLPNQDITVQFSIIPGTPLDNPVYQETHSVKTNPLGLFSLNIGAGTPVLGKFDEIAWETMDHFLKIEIDPDAGTSYSDMGTVQFLSVPYALVAKKSVLSEGVDVDVTGLQVDDMLKWNGGTWVPGSGSGDDDWSFPAVPDPTHMWATNTAVNVLIGIGAPANNSKVQIRNSDGQPKEVDILTNAGDGIDIGVTGRHGLYIHGPIQQNAISIDGVNIITGDAIDIKDPKGIGVDIKGTGSYGIKIEGRVDADAIHISEDGANNIFGSGLEVGGTGDHALFVNDGNGKIGGDALRINVSQPAGLQGNGINIQSTAAGGIPQNGISINATAAGSIAGDGIKIESAQGGITGHGIVIKKQDANNKKFGLYSSVASDDDFEGFAILATKGLAGRTSVSSAAISGESNVMPGVRGLSKESSGVIGSFSGASNYAVGPGGGPGKLRAGVQGEASQTGGHDSFGVLGTTSGYGHGVLGIGGTEIGWGVMGISGVSSSSSTTAAIRGVTSEGTWPYWPLSYSSGGKKSVGVLGQAKEYVAIWGESLNSTGVVGTTGPELKLTDVEFYNRAGVIGMSTVADKYGVIGQSKLASGVQGSSDSELEFEAGVYAQGNGVKAPGQPNAAALMINHGAITVTGTIRPAGVITVNPNWFEDYTKEGGSSSHSHQHGWSVSPITWQHPLLKPNSIILITLESNQLPMYAQVYSRAAGSAELHLYCTMVQQPPSSVLIHYLIINPE